MAAADNSSSRRRRRLTVAERYQVFLDVVSGAGSQRDIADKRRIDRTTVAHVCKVAKQGALDALAADRPGRPGKTAAELALEYALADEDSGFAEHDTPLGGVVRWRHPTAPGCIGSAKAFGECRADGGLTVVAAVATLARETLPRR